MKIKEIYCTKRHGIVSLAMAALCVGVTLVTAFFPDTYTKLTYSYPLQYPWQICSGIFVHGSPNFSVTETIGHLGFNLLLVLPFGILIEKIIGSKRFLLFTLYLWLLNAVTFYLIGFFMTPKGEHTYAAGISGIAFSYGAVGLYVLWKLLRQNPKSTLKQVSFYLLLNIAVVMLIMVNPFVAGILSMIMHLVAVLGGVAYLVVRHRDIDRFLEQGK